MLSASLNKIFPSFLFPPDDAKFLGSTYIGYGDSYLPLHSWELKKASHPNITKRMSVTQDGCTPIMEATFGYVDHSMFVLLYKLTHTHPNLYIYIYIKLGCVWVGVFFLDGYITFTYQRYITRLFSSSFFAVEVWNSAPSYITHIMVLDSRNTWSYYNFSYLVIRL